MGFNSLQVERLEYIEDKIFESLPKPKNGTGIITIEQKGSIEKIPALWRDINFKVKTVNAPLRHRWFNNVLEYKKIRVKDGEKTIKETDGSADPAKVANFFAQHIVRGWDFMDNGVVVPYDNDAKKFLEKTITDSRTLFNITSQYVLEMFREDEEETKKESENFIESPTSTSEPMDSHLEDEPL